MDYYLDIHFQNNSEIPVNQTLSVLYCKLHQALVDINSSQVGVSFPKFQASKPSLGSHLRLHGSGLKLEQLMVRPWLSGMQDYINIGDSEAIPSTVQYRRVRRVQAKSNPDRLRRRMMMRHGIDEAAAKVQIPDHVSEVLKLPFVQMDSTSSGHHFRLFIDHGEPSEEPTNGVFSLYGLSSSATVPWF